MGNLDGKVLEIMSNKNFERIVAYLSEEGCPKTPNEISNWTGILLVDIYQILQSNNMFQQILDGDTLKGWIVDAVFVSSIPEASPFSYNCGGQIK